MLLYRVKYNIFQKVQVPLALYMKLWVIDHTGKMGVKMEDFKVYLCVSPAETTQASQEGFRFATWRIESERLSVIPQRSRR